MPGSQSVAISSSQQYHLLLSCLNTNRGNRWEEEVCSSCDQQIHLHELLISGCGTKRYCFSKAGTSSNEAPLTPLLPSSNITSSCPFNYMCVFPHWTKTVTTFVHISHMTVIPHLQPDPLHIYSPNLAPAPPPTYIYTPSAHAHPDDKNMTIHTLWAGIKCEHAYSEAAR